MLPPTIAPHAMEKKRSLPYSLSLGLRCSAAATSIAMGKSIAVVAWLGMKTVATAPVTIIPIAKAKGERSKRRSIRSAQRLLNPVSVSAPPIRKIPMRKKIADEPNDE